MASRRTTQTHSTEAQLLVLPDRADAPRTDAMTGFAAPTDEAVMNCSLSDRTQTNRKLRCLLIVGTASAWLAIIAAIRFFFF